jgi:hypothetical protein
LHSGVRDILPAYLAGVVKTSYLPLALAENADVGISEHT